MNKFKGIKTDKEFFIDSGGLNSYGMNLILFDGKKPEPSFKDGWWKLKGKPKKLQKIIPQKDVNHRYELVDKSLECDKFPFSFSIGEVTYEDDCERYWKKEYQHLSSLYKLVSDKEESKLEDLDFEIEIIFTIDNMDNYVDFNFKGTYDNFGCKDYFIKENSVIHNTVDCIIFPDILLHTTTSKLSVENTYRIIRHHIKNNIDPKWAEVTSDYDFCFTVKKKIPLSTIEEYTVDVNNGIFQTRKRKPKYETRYKKSRYIGVFEMAPKPYQEYTVIKPFEGKNLKSLKGNIEKFLEDLMSKINKPLKDCPQCKGCGVIIED